jgi:repressor LexA
MIGTLAFGRFSGKLSFGFRSGGSVPLTRRQREILDFISTQISGQGYAPSFEEIAERFSFRSLATVHEHLTNLERKGYIHRAHNESRGIEIVPPRGQTGATELPLQGLVAAGEPIEAVAGHDTLAVPDDLIPRRGRSYVLKVRGQSMIDEHIKDGDFIVVHERNQADNGQTVVALVHGSSATVKRFYREPGGWIRLEPANATMTALRLNERDVMVQGVVVGVIRKY